MVGWHYRLDGHEFEQALGVGDGQGSLACFSPWGRKELDMTEWLNWAELRHTFPQLQAEASSLLVLVALKMTWWQFTSSWTFGIESEKRLWSRMSNLKACGGQALHVDVWGGCRLGWGHLPFSSFWPVNNLLTDFLILERCQDVGFVHGICFPNAGKSFKLKNKNCVIRMNHHCGLHQVLSLPPALASLVLPPREGWGDLNFYSHYLVVS